MQQLLFKLYKCWCCLWQRDCSGLFHGQAKVF